MNLIQAAHPIVLKDPNKPRTFYASCIITLPNGSIERVYQFGGSEISAVVALGNLVQWRYGVVIQQSAAVTVPTAHGPNA